MKILVFYVDKQYFNMVILFLRLRVRRELIIRRDGRAVEGTGLENRRSASFRGFESHPLRHAQSKKKSVSSNPFDLQKYPRGRRGSPAKGVGRVKSAAEVQILSSAPSKNLEAITVSRFFLFLVKTFLLRFGIVPSVGYIVGDIVVYFTDFVLQLTLLFIILSWAEDSSSSHEIDSVEYR